MRRMFWLYRPTAPSVRAQSIQVVHTAHASARRGHAVTLCVQAATAGTTAGSVLDFYGLEPIPTLDLRVLPVGNPLASAAFRVQFARWTLRGGTVIARSKRYAVAASRWAPGPLQLIVEAHEVDSEQVREAGGDPTPMRALEARALSAAAGVICNCEGTRDLLIRTHPGGPPTAVLHNGTHATRVRHPTGPGEGIGYAGSLRTFKDPTLLAEAAAALAVPLVFVGTEPDPELVARSGGKLRFEPPLPHRDLPDRLVQFAALALPVAPGLFGEQLTSPLKLWDYLAVGRPIVAADTPALRNAAAGAFEPYRVGDAASLIEALRRVLARTDGPAPRRVRTWDDRALELDTFLDGL